MKPSAIEIYAGHWGCRILALLLALGLPSLSTGEAQNVAAPVTLAINTAQANTNSIPSDFSGLSFEMGSVVYDSVNKGWFLSGTNNAMIGLLKTLGVKNIRVGGNSAEGGNIATNADEQAALDFCHAIGSSLMWDLEIKDSLYDPPGKAAIAQSMQNYVNSQNYGSNILMFQVGNEPDLTDNPTNSSVHMSDVIYEGLFNTYVSAVNQLYSGSKWCGPDCAAGGTWYAQTFCPVEAADWPGQIQFVCMHQYPFGSSLDTNTTAVHIGWMLAPGVEAGYQSDNKGWVPNVFASGQAPRYEECNSFFHNGSFGASDAMASALWGLGWMYYQANAGLAGINFHTGENANNPAYNAVTPANVTNSYVVHPLAYAMKAFDLGSHGYIVPVTIGNSSNVNLVAYSVLQYDGSLMVTVINRDYGSLSTNASLVITTSGNTYNAGQVMYLTAPNNDPSVTSGVTLGGSAISGTTGGWSGAYQGMARPVSGLFTAPVPSAEAAVIRVFNAAGPAAPTNLMAMTGNSQATLNWSNSPGAASYVIQRSGNTGGPYVTIASGVTTDTYTDTGLTNGLVYYYVVAATNSSGIGPESAEAIASLSTLPPPTPTGLNAIPGDTVVSLSWNPSPGATNYILSSSTSSGGPYGTTNNLTGTSYLNTGLTDGTTYYYVISAAGPYGQSQQSAQVSATPFSAEGISWTNNITASAQSWNVNANWSNGTGFPNGTQTAALVNSLIPANQTINLNQAITVSTLNIGASGGAASFNIAGNGGALTFDDTPAFATLLQLASSKGDTISAPVTFNGGLNIQNAAANPLTLSGIISGTNTLVVNGGTVVLGAANTFSGTAAIAQGTMQLANSLALQDGFLNYTNGSLAFSGITAATLGGLTGANSTVNLVLQNTASAAVALTVGGNNVATVYGGSLSGTGSLTQNGTGSSTLSSANYTGSTTVSLGTLDIIGGSFGGSGSTFAVQGTSGSSATAFATVSGGMINAGQVNIATGGNQYGAALTISGTAGAMFATGFTMGGSSTAGGLTINTTGSVSLGAAAPTRDGGTGLVIQNGTVTANSMDVKGSGSAGTANANMSISGGSLTIGTTSSSGAFKVGDTTQSGGGHGGALTMSGGTLTYLGTDGLLLGASGTSGLTEHGNATISGGTANLSGVTLNAGNISDMTSTLMVNGAAAPMLYLGSIGLVAHPSTTTVSATLGNALIGAIANWSSAAPVTLISNTVFSAADASGVVHNISLSGVLSGTGGLTQAGGGVLVLGATNTYSGSTTVSTGQLLVNGSLAASGTVTVNGGGVLGGTGVVNGPANIMTGGTLSPGAAFGTLTFGGTLTLAAGCTNLLAVSHGPLTNGMAKISGMLVNGGTLIVTNLGTAALAAGDSFKLFTATSYSGAFAHVILPPLTAGLAWNTNSLNTNGTLSVILAANPVFGAVTFTGSALEFSGTGGVGNASYYLMFSTNLTTPLTNWARLLTNQFDGNGNFNFTSPPNGNWPQEFYRLQEP